LLPQLFLRMNWNIQPEFVRVKVINDICI